MRKLTMMLKSDETRKLSIKSANTDTIQSMSPAAKKVFIKIKEQLEDKSHPLIRIISSF